MSEPAKTEDFFAFLDDPATPTRPVTAAMITHTKAHVETCPRCRGSGATRWGPCFKCKGAGSKTFKTSSIQRAATRQKSAEKKQRTAAENWAAFSARHPEVAAWIAVQRSAFAMDMRPAVENYGDLTPGQLAACQRGVERDREREAARAVRIADAPVVDLSRITAAFDVARGNGLKKPKLRIAGIKFSCAPATGNNPGAVYVKDGDTYIGKVLRDGKFIQSRDCNDEQQRRVFEVAADPKTSAIAHGIKTGECSICGAELTNKESITRGIGPICAGRYGW